MTIHVVCGGTALADFVIPAGVRAGTPEHTYTNIPAGTVCTVTETANGSSAAVSVVTVGSGQTVTVPAGGTATVELSNDYTFNPGSLTVTKTINGPARPPMVAITIEVTCDGTLLSRCSRSRPTARPRPPQQDVHGDPRQRDVLRRRDGRRSPACCDRRPSAVASR